MRGRDNLAAYTGEGVALPIGDLGLWQWLALLQHELLLFAGIFFLIGAADDLAVDALWLWLRATGRAKAPVRKRAALVTGRCTARRR